MAMKVEKEIIDERPMLYENESVKELLKAQPYKDVCRNFRRYYKSGGKKRLEYDDKFQFRFHGKKENVVIEVSEAYNLEEWQVRTDGNGHIQILIPAIGKNISIMTDSMAIYGYVPDSSCDLKENTWGWIDFKYQKEREDDILYDGALLPYNLGATNFLKSHNKDFIQSRTIDYEKLWNRENPSSLKYFIDSVYDSELTLRQMRDAEEAYYSVNPWSAGHVVRHLKEHFNFSADEAYFHVDKEGCDSVRIIIPNINHNLEVIEKYMAICGYFPMENYSIVGKNMWIELAFKPNAVKSITKQLKDKEKKLYFFRNEGSHGIFRTEHVFSEPTGNYGIWQYENAVYFVKSSAGKSKINEIRRRYSQNLRKGMLYEKYISIYSIETKDISDEVCFFEEEKDNSIVYTGDENLIMKLCIEGTAKFETQIRLERW